MQHELRRSGLKLVLAGLLGMLFFWLTDPGWGLARQAHSMENPIDARNEALIGTMVGIGCSAVVLVLGAWIATRRAT